MVALWSNQPIPFDFQSEPILCIDYHGFDFGIIAIRQHYQNLLAANGILPTEKTNWKSEMPEQLDLCIVIGLPEELFTPHWPLLDRFLRGSQPAQQVEQIRNHLLLSGEHCAHFENIILDLRIGYCRGDLLLAGEQQKT